MKEALYYKKLKDDIINKLKPGLFGLKEYDSISITKLAAGCYNLNYLVKLDSKKFVFRLGVHSDIFEGNNLKKEFKILKELNSLHCPKAIYYSENFKYPLLVEEYIAGKKILRLSNILIKNISKALAKIHLHIPKRKTSSHSIKKVYIMQFKKRLKLIKKNKKMYRELLKYVNKAIKYVNKKEKLFRKYRKNTLLHGDMRCDNILIKDNKIVFVDWENNQINDPTFDIVAFFYESENLQYFNKKTSISNANKSLFLKEYLKINQDPYLKEKINIIYPLRWLSDTLWLACRIVDYNNIPNDLRDKSKKEYLRLYQFNLKKLKGMW